MCVSGEEQWAGGGTGIYMKSGAEDRHETCRVTNHR